MRFVSHARKDKPFRAILKKTGEFLHLSGSGFTRDINWAWTGTLNQFMALKSHMESAGHWNQEDEWTLQKKPYESRLPS